MVRKLDIQVAQRAVAVVFAAALCVFRVFANDGFDDGVDRSDPKFVVAWLVFVLAAVAAVANWRRVCWAFLAVQAAAGCFFVYFVSASHLPTSAWNWLLVPFNPVMPALACWRRFRAVRWALGAYVAALLNWIVMMLFVPHAKTDPAFIVLGGAMALVYATTVGENRLFKLLRRGSDAGSEGV